MFVDFHPDPEEGWGRGICGALPIAGAAPRGTLSWALGTASLSSESPWKLGWGSAPRSRGAPPSCGRAELRALVPL